MVAQTPCAPRSPREVEVWAFVSLDDRPATANAHGPDGQRAAVERAHEGGSGPQVPSLRIEGIRQTDPLDPAVADEDVAASTAPTSGSGARRWPVGHARGHVAHVGQLLGRHSDIGDDATRALRGPPETRWPHRSPAPRPSQHDLAITRPAISAPKSRYGYRLVSSQAFPVMKPVRRTAGRPA